MTMSVTSVADWKFKTHGAIFDALKPDFRQAQVDARYHFGTNRYFVQRDLEVHKAFDRFCHDNGLSAAETASLRGVVKQTAEEYPNMATESIRALCECCPSEFCVRGAWTSQRAVVHIDASVN